MPSKQKAEQTKTSTQISSKTLENLIFGDLILQITSNALQKPIHIYSERDGVGAKVFDEVSKFTTHKPVDVGLNPAQLLNTTNAWRPNPVSLQEIHEILYLLKNTKAVGHDNISLQYIKDSFNVTAPFLRLIINTSIATNKFPDQWKHSIIKPLHKAGDINTASNYRPISILLAESTQWFQSYLPNRSHAVRLENTISSPIQNDFGVPQGSILSPLLFSIFINDFPSMPSNTRISMYTNDVQIAMTSAPVNTLTPKWYVCGPLRLGSVNFTVPSSNNMYKVKIYTGQAIGGNVLNYLTQKQMLKYF
ncbi:Reverse transcriptase domain [Trinorchestia longiramus]|nr:Reverse transcriptase domain [Trinorchestia longiramus]